MKKQINRPTRLEMDEYHAIAFLSQMGYSSSETKKSQSLSTVKTKVVNEFTRKEKKKASDNVKK